MSGYCTVKQYGNEAKKLVFFKYCWKPKDTGKPHKINDVKLEENLRRASGKLKELVLCNPFDMFMTITLAKDRNNLAKWKKSLNDWLTYYNKKHNTKIKYLLVPELHSDMENWHMHGFLMGLPIDHTTPFIEGVHPQKLIDADYMNWQAYQNKFGFVSLGIIRNKSAAANYMTKYIKKQLATHGVKELNKHTYYHSKGLETAVTIAKGTLRGSNAPFDYENDYVGVKWYLNSIKVTDIITPFDNMDITNKLIL